jgi:O-antigen polymerase
MTDLMFDRKPNFADATSRCVNWLAISLVAFPWFWPIAAGPLPAMLPDLAAWTAGAILVGVWYFVRDQFDRIVAWGLLWASLGSAVLGLLQYFDLENNFGVWVVLTRPGEVTANIQQINLLATLLAVGLLCNFYLLQTKLLSGRHVAWMVITLVVALAATASRTGMVHLVLIAMVILYWWPNRRVRTFAVLLGVAALYLVATQLLPWLAQWLSGTSPNQTLLTRLGADFACASRKVLWANVAQLISLKPWSGWGPGELMYAHYITPYEGARFCAKLSNAHNLPIQLAFVWGIPAAIIACFLALWALLRIKPWMASTDQEKFAWAILLLIGFHSLVEFPLWFGLFQVLAVLAVILILAEHRKAGGKILSEVRAKTLFGISVLMLVTLGLVAADYFKVSQLYLPVTWRSAWYQDDTLNKVRDTMLFKSEVLIAQVVATDVTSENAPAMLIASLEALHIAPDSRIIRQVILSAKAAGREDLVSLHTERYKASWPQLYEQWLMEQTSVN